MYTCTSLSKCKKHTHLGIFCKFSQLILLKPTYETVLSEDNSGPEIVLVHSTEKK